jgi:ferric-dicitrate binding protein FerR (iron transport regulator)
MNNFDLHESLSRYFAGEATAEERAQVEAWQNAAAENQRLFAAFQKIWQGAAEKTPRLPSVDQAWAELSAQLGLPQENAPAKILEMRKPATAARKIFRSDNYRWAAAAVLLLGFATLIYQFFYNTNALQKMSAAYGRQESIELPDGSLVQLNSGSEIRFYENFSDSARVVALSGEAYFEVNHDDRPFYVNTGNAQVRVLGTKFGVRARDEQTRVTVREGRVSLRGLKAAPSTAVELTANQTSVCQQQSAPVPPAIVDAGQVLGWLEGKIVFDQTPLTEVAAELQRVYNVAIELANPALGQNTITGSFQNKPVESVLASICLAMNLQYAQAENKFVISE